MTDRDNEIRQRCEAATPGPWKLLVRGNTVKSFAIEGVCGGMKYVDRSDAAFIAASRTDIPYLLDRIAELRVEIERKDQVLAVMENDVINAEMNLQRLTDEIERLREASRWIPCKDRLPEAGRCVLVRQTYRPFREEHGEFEESTVGYLHQPTDERRKPYFYWVDVSDYGDMVRAESICPGSKYITHWRPLPEPPKEGE